MAVMPAVFKENKNTNRNKKTSKASKHPASIMPTKLIGTFLVLLLCLIRSLPKIQICLAFGTFQSWKWSNHAHQQSQQCILSSFSSTFSSHYSLLIQMAKFLVDVGTVNKVRVCSMKRSCVFNEALNQAARVSCSLWTRDTVVSIISEGNNGKNANDDQWPSSI